MRITQNGNPKGLKKRTKVGRTATEKNYYDNKKEGGKKL